MSLALMQAMHELFEATGVGALLITDWKQKFAGQARAGQGGRLAIALPSECAEMVQITSGKMIGICFEVWPPRTQKFPPTITCQDDFKSRKGPPEKANQPQTRWSSTM